MKKYFLFFALLIPFGLFAVTIQEALKKKLIKIENAEAVGGFSTKALTILVQNNQKKQLYLEIPAGTIFQPNDSIFQPLVVTQLEIYTFAPTEKHSFSLQGFCSNAHLRSPMQGGKYSVSALATGALLDIVKFIAQRNIQDEADIQSAVWAATNQHRAEALNNDELKQFVAKATGQTLRAIQVIYNQSAHPGESALIDNKLKVKGLFKYTTEKDIVANLGLYDENGKLIKNLQSDLRHQRGMHKFGFNFEISNLKHERYFIRLVSGKMTISEMEVNF